MCNFQLFLLHWSCYIETARDRTSETASLTSSALSVLHAWMATQTSVSSRNFSPLTRIKGPYWSTSLLHCSERRKETSDLKQAKNLIRKMFSNRCKCLLSTKFIWNLKGYSVKKHCWFLLQIIFNSYQNYSKCLPVGHIVPSGCIPSEASWLPQTANFVRGIFRSAFANNSHQYFV